MPLFVLTKEIVSLNIRDYTALVHDNYKYRGDTMLFLNDLRPKIDVILHEELIRQNGVKYSLMMMAVLAKMKLSIAQVYSDNVATSDFITTTAYFRSEAKPVINNDDSNIQAAIDTIQSI